MSTKGFTLIELLATIVIIGLIMAVTIPNVLNIINKNRADAYASDARKLQTMAEYKFRADKNITRPATSNDCTIMTLNYLGTSDFSDAPNGGKYNVDKSYVVIKRADDTTGISYIYYISLVEDLTDNKERGIDLTDIDTIASSKNNLTLIKDSGFVVGNKLSSFPHKSVSSGTTVSCSSNSTIYMSNS